MYRSGALATFLLPLFGYDAVEMVVQQALREDKSVRDVLLEKGLMDAERFETLMNPRRMYKLGFSTDDYQGDDQ